MFPVLLMAAGLGASAVLLDESFGAIDTNARPTLSPGLQSAVHELQQRIEAVPLLASQIRSLEPVILTRDPSSGRPGLMVGFEIWSPDSHDSTRRAEKGYKSPAGAALEVLQAFTVQVAKRHGLGSSLVSQPKGGRQTWTVGLTVTPDVFSDWAMPSPQEADAALKRYRIRNPVVRLPDLPQLKNVRLVGSRPRP